MSKQVSPNIEVPLKVGWPSAQERLVRAFLQWRLFEEFLAQKYLRGLESSSQRANVHAIRDCSDRKRLMNERCERRVALIARCNRSSTTPQITGEFNASASHTIHQCDFKECLWYHRKIRNGVCCGPGTAKLVSWGLEKSSLQSCFVLHHEAGRIRIAGIHGPYPAKWQFFRLMEVQLWC